MQKNTFMQTLFRFFSSFSTKINPKTDLQHDEQKKQKPRQWSNNYYKDFWEHCKS